LERDAARAERERAEALGAEAEERLKTARKGQHDDAVEALKRARLELDRVRVQLKKAALSSREEAELAEKEAEGAIGRAAQEVNKHAPSVPGPAGRAATADDLVVGAEVLVPRLGGRGVVTAAPRGGKVAVQVGALKITVDETELLVPLGHGKSRPAGTRGVAQAGAGGSGVPGKFASTPGPAAATATAIRTPDNTMDLRGERVDAAIAMAEKFLDDALRDEQGIVYFVHGHGTGALRGALREHLKIVPGVASVRPGDASEGGDGVTVVHLE
jgi:DNA mismatch repair protein MutS2